MSDTFTNEDPDGPRMATLPRKAVRKLEREAAEGREAKRQLEEIQTRNAFLEAGVPVDNPAAEYFIRGYSGERTKEAITAEWSRAFGNVDNGQQEQQQHQSQIEKELAAQAGGQDLIGGPGVPTQDKLAERDAKLAALSPTDPLYPQKFDEIARSYGTVYGDMVG